MIALIPAWLRDSRFSLVLTGFLVVLVGFASSVALVIQAAEAAGASAAQTATWIAALCLGAAFWAIVVGGGMLFAKRRDSRVSEKWHTQPFK